MEAVQALSDSFTADLKVSEEEAQFVLGLLRVSVHGIPMHCIDHILLGRMYRDVVGSGARLDVVGGRQPQLT